MDAAEDGAAKSSSKGVVALAAESWRTKKLLARGERAGGTLSVMRGEKKTSVRTLISGKSVLNRGSKEESFSLFFEFKIVGGVFALEAGRINSCLLLGSGLKECSCRESCWQHCWEVVHKLSLTEISAFRLQFSISYFRLTQFQYFQF